jgi:hypothetical protein
VSLLRSKLLPSQKGKWLTIDTDAVPLPGTAGNTWYLITCWVAVEVKRLVRVMTVPR